MKQKRRRISSIVYDEYILFKKEKEVYHTIFKETVLKNRRCAKLSLGDIQKATNLGRTTINYQLKLLEKKRMIEIDRTQKTNKICINIIYTERPLFRKINR